MPTTIRRAEETNWRYRLVEEDDLVAGLELLYIDADTRVDPTVFPTVFGSTIVLEDDPIRDIAGGQYVYYRFVQLDGPEAVGFVPLKEFTGQFDRHPNDYRSRYWLPL